MKTNLVTNEADQMNKLINALASKGIRLSDNDGKLKVLLGAASISDEESEQIGVSKADLLNYLNGRKVSSLSMAQESIWRLSHQEGASLYHLSVFDQYTGKVNEEAFYSAIKYLGNRHESLRTSFEELEGNVLQFVSPQVDFDAAVVDLTSLAINEEAEHLSGEKAKFTERPFNLSKPALFRAVAINLPGDRFLVGFCVHQIIADQHSLCVLTEEFGEAYARYSNDTEPDLSPAGLQLMDYVSWQRTAISPAKCAEDIEHWQEQLAGVEDLDLLTDFSRNATQSGTTARTTFLLPEADLGLLKQLAGEMNVPVSSIFLAAVYALIYQHSHQSNFGITVPVANRDTPETERLIGLLASEMAVNIAGSELGGMTCREVVRAIQEVLLKGQDHQSLPFDQLLEELAREERLGHRPTFRAFFDLEISSQLPDNDFLKAVNSHSPERDFSFKLIENATKELVLVLDYEADLYLENTVKDLMRCLGHILNGFIHTPDAKVADIPLTDEQQRQELLEIGSAKSAVTEYHTLHHLIEQSAHSAPHHPALLLGDRQVTYQELNDRANQLASYLLEKGVEKGDRVAISLPADDTLIISIFAVLKTGAAYVPIDPYYPAERKDFMIADCACKILISTSQTIGEVGVPEIEDVINLQSDAGDIKEATATVTPNNDPTSLAYIIYTSGSTGRPKGVMVRHQQTNRIVWKPNYVEVSPGDRFMQLSNFAFDGSIYDIFTPLCNGATVALLPKGKDFKIEDAAQALLEMKVTKTFMTTALFNAMVDSFPDALKHLDHILIGGEKMSALHLNKGLELMPDAQVFNIYGPTETTVYATFYPITQKATGINVPIGNAIGDTQLLVLDAAGKLVPKGVPGELFIGGDGVSVGYLNREDLTAERFVDNPYDPAGGKMYRTGDLVRWNSQGHLVYMDRVDQQVKVRGYRIELGEIEHAITQYEGIVSCAVIAREIQSTKQLVGFYTGNGVDENALKSTLQAQLPDYMVPSVLTRLAEIPLTPNGKTDKKKLAKHALNTTVSSNYTASSNKTEAQIAEIWEDLLKLENVGVTDSFYELGGHSLLVAQMLYRVNSQFGVSLNLRDLFTNPTIQGIAQLIEVADQVETVTLAPQQRPEYIPLSYAQERLWFINELGQGDQYHIPGFLIINGAFDLSAFRQAINGIVARHENLRTCFRTQDDQPYQFIQEQLEIHLERHQCIGQNADSEEVGEIMMEFTKRPFDFVNGPLVRVLLVELATDQYLLGINLHHIIADGWSFTVFSNELSAFYNAAVAGSTPELPPLAIQYADYTLWQQQMLTPEVLEEELTHWKEHLAGYEDLAMPTDHRRPATLSGRGDTVQTVLDEEVAVALCDMAHEQGGTVFSSLLAGVYAILHIYSGQEDLCVGTPVANRSHEAMENLIGFFVNTVVNRVKVSKDEPLSDLVTKVRDELFRSQNHQGVPFEKVVDFVKPERDLSRTPLFQVMVNYLNMDAEAVHFGEARMEGIATHSESAKFDLNFTFRDTGSGSIYLGLEYSLDLYERQTIDQLLNDLKSLYQLIVQEPAKSLSAIDLVKRDETLAEKAIYTPATQTIQAALEEVANLVPNRTAVRDEHSSLSFAELKQQSDQLALYLHQQGVKKDDLVAISLERSTALIVAIVGVLKSGAAYFYIDGNYPAERQQSILQDSDARVLITMDQHSAIADETVSTIRLDNELDQQAINSASGVLVSPMDPSGLSYVIYTSGSTGKPKGVLQTHRTIVNLVRYQQEVYGHDMEVPKQVSQFASAGFDVSIQEIFFTLLSGYTLHITPEQTRFDTAKMVQFIADHQIAISYLPTAYLEYFCREYLRESSADLSKLERIIVAGEALKINEATKTFFQQQPHIRLENQYGPSETHVVTAYTMPESIAQWSEFPSIGRAIDNCGLYLLNESMIEVPKGAVGELYFTGEGIARGYLHNESLTFERFILHQATGQRMYKTGDLARIGADGNLQFIGRADTQVKIRGFRIELGEVDTVLAGHQQIASVATIAKELDGSMHLVSFYTTVSEEVKLDDTELKTFIGGKLPDYMVPSVLKSVEEIPLNHNGKVDRMLLAKEAITFESAVEFVEAEGAVEAEIAAIWSELLKKEKVGVSDNFFELGGHSLLATQVISRINRKFNAAVELKTLFSQPTVRQLAAQLSEQSAETTTQPVKNRFFERMDRTDKIPLSYAQERLWYINEMGQGHLYHMPELVRLSGEFDQQALRGAIQLLVQRHESLRTIMVEEGGVAYQYILDELEIPFRHLNLKGKPNAASLRSETIAHFVNDWFDLKEGPLLRVLIIEEEAGGFTAGLCMHHIISDGWSMKVLRQELNHFYTCLRDGQDPALPPLQAQYADYAIWQKQKFAGGVLEEALESWKTHLEGYEDLAMPTDFARPAKISGEGSAISVAMASDLSKKVKDFSQQHGVTVFNTLLTGLFATLHTFSRQEDLCIGMPVANRTDEQLEGLIGFFVNTMVNRVNVRSGQTLQELQAAVKNELIRSQNYQDVPFEKIVEAVKPPRDISRTPIFQVMASFADPGLQEGQTTKETNQEESYYNISKFELNFIFADGGDQLYTTLEYNTDLYKEATVRNYLEVMESILEALVTQPSQKISEIDLLTVEERNMVLEQFNEGVEYPAIDQTLHQLFAEQVTANPEQVALYFGEETMTYQELDQQSKKMALYLQGLGMKPGKRIALCLNRSMEMLVAILAVLKSGAAYVPIDPQYPDERTQYMLQDSGCDLMITEDAIQLQKEALFEGLRTVLSIDRDQLLFEACEGYLTPYTDPEALAYIIYTSGSTGKPKGTLIRHRNVPRVCKYPNYVDINTGDRILQLSNYAFDGSVFDIFAALLNGAGLVLIKQETLLNIQDLAAYMNTQQVTISFMTTALFNSLVDHSMEALEGLRKILFGGEMVSVRHVNQAIERLGSNRVVHVYGPTETTVYATYFPINEPTVATNIPIGKPLTGTGLYVLNESMKAVPVGITGELYISGDGLAEGYLNRPDLTAERFVENPYKPGSLIYKTGDLVKWDKEGNILFEGRADQQVKVRGFRIELGEIEHAMTSYGPISRSAVITRAFKGSKQIIAFYVATEPVSTEELRQFLGAELPQYMIPAWFEAIDDIPLNANGKTDVKALTKRDIKLISQHEYVEPERPEEKQLATIWQEVLEVEKVGLNDNFFDMGGHSLLATQILSRVNEAFGSQIALSQLLEEPTLKAMAKMVGPMDEALALSVPPADAQEKPSATSSVSESTSSVSVGLESDDEAPPKPEAPSKGTFQGFEEGEEEVIL